MKATAEDCSGDPKARKEGAKERREAESRARGRRTEDAERRGESKHGTSLYSGVGEGVTMNNIFSFRFDCAVGCKSWEAGASARELEIIYG